MDSLPAAVLACTASVFAQSDSVEELRARLEQKLAEPFVANVDWLTDYDAALERAKAGGAPIFAYFTRSYAPCMPCKKVEHEVLGSEAFAEFAATVVPFLHVTTHIPGRVHDGLLAEKRGRGFPTLLLLDERGRIVSRPAARTVAAFREAAAAARQAMTRANTEHELSPAARAALYVRQRTLGNYAGASADRSAYLEHRAHLSRAQRDAIERDLAMQELRRAVDDVNLLESSAAEMTTPEHEARLLRLLAAREALGGWPKGAPGNRALIALIAWADARGDIVLFREWLAQLREVRAGTLRHNEEFLAWFDARLSALESGTATDDFATAFRARIAGSRRPQRKD